MELTIELSVSASAVTCLEDHMISYIDKTTTFKLWCGNDGVYACDSPSGETVVCPECHGNHTAQYLC